MRWPNSGVPGDQDDSKRSAMKKTAGDSKVTMCTKDTVIVKHLLVMNHMLSGL